MKKGCFACTDLDVFHAAGELDDVTDAVTSYVNYCVDLGIPLKKAKHYNNNKQWFNKDINPTLSQIQLCHQTRGRNHY